MSSEIQGELSSTQQVNTSQNDSIIYSTSHSQQKHSYKRVLLIFLLTALFALVAGVFFGLGIYFSESRQRPTNNIAQTLPTPTQDPFVGWELYRVNALKLEFRVPPSFSVFGFLSETEIPESGSEKAVRLCMTFPKKSVYFIRPVFAETLLCEINHFAIVALSSNSKNSGTDFMSIQGFVNREGKYFARLLDKEEEIPMEYVSKITNQYGVNIIKIRSFTLSSQETTPPSYYPGNNRIGALINTKDSKYRGFAVIAEFDNTISEGIFDTILSTFDFIE